MALLSSPGKGKSLELSVTKPVRVPIKISASLLDRMKEHHKPKEKSIWVAAALHDLLDREIYRDADWESPNDDTEAFIALLNFKFRATDPKTDTFLLPADVYHELCRAVERITKIYPSLASRVRPALLRAAITQRLLLKGALLSKTLYSSTPDR